MKKAVLLLAAVMVCISFCACGGEKTSEQDSQESNTQNSQLTVVDLPDNKKNVPSKEQIMGDIESALQNKNEYATLTSVETLKSLTEEGSFELTLAITAETKYADWSYEADLHYTKYDQGWMIDSTSWNTADYVLTRIPDGEAMVDIANAVVCTSYEKLYPIQNGIVYSEYTLESEILEFDWTVTKELLHAERCLTYMTLWTYNKDTDSWDMIPYNEYDEMICTADDIVTPYNVDFSGVWAGAISSIEISDFSWDGFNVTIDGSTNYFERIVGSPSDTSDHSSIWYYGDGKYLNINFYEDETYIIISRITSSNVAALFSTSITKELPSL